MISDCCIEDDYTAVLFPRVTPTATAAANSAAGKCCTLERRFVPPYAVNLYLFDDASSQSSEISNVECKVAYKLC
jgi:hypothetical protein